MGLEDIVAGVGTKIKGVVGNAKGLVSYLSHLSWKTFAYAGVGIVSGLGLGYLGYAYASGKWPFVKLEDKRFYPTQWLIVLLDLC